MHRNYLIDRSPVYPFFERSFAEMQLSVEDGIFLLYGVYLPVPAKRHLISSLEKFSGVFEEFRREALKRY